MMTGGEYKFFNELMGPTAKVRGETNHTGKHITRSDHAVKPILQAQALGQGNLLTINHSQKWIPPRLKWSFHSTSSLIKSKTTQANNTLL